MSNEQLALYKGALRILGSASIATLSDNVEARYVLDEIWANGAISYCLEAGYWSFATRTVKITYDPSVSPAFGYHYAFSKPTDYVKLKSICLNEYFTTPLCFYADETSYWYADTQTLYVRYISSDSLYGGNMGNYPQSFGNLVEAYLASAGNMRITKSIEMQRVADKVFHDALRDARAKDAMNQPAMFQPAGNWTRSRIGGSNSGQWCGIFATNGVRDY